jgi:hypothetical protein
VHDTPIDLIEAQLYDELYARVWAAAAVTDPPPRAVLPRPVAERLAVTSRQWSRDLCGADRPTAERAAAAVATALWPTSWVPAAGDEWWRSPLGAAMRCAERTVGRRPTGTTGMSTPTPAPAWSRHRSGDGRAAMDRRVAVGGR